MMEPTARDWPVLMDLNTAGDYLALAPGSLMALLRREHVSPVDLGLRARRWRRRDLDDLVERLPLTWVQAARGDPDERTRSEAALAAVERRAEAARQRVSGRGPREVRQSHPPA
jgi:hypothetical protein